MNLSVCNPVRLACLAALLSATLGVEAQTPASPIKGTPPSQATPLPDSPGTVWYEAQNDQTNAIQLDESQTQASPPAQQSASEKPRPTDAGSPQKPVGTAAAEAPNVSAVAASQPAGIAMAPAKQHRVRTIVLKTGAIIGAGVAIGAVVALTAATSSKPPGAR